MSVTSNSVTKSPNMHLHSHKGALHRVVPSSRAWTRRDALLFVVVPQPKYRAAARRRLGAVHAAAHALVVPRITVLPPSSGRMPSAVTINGLTRLTCLSPAYPRGRRCRGRLGRGGGVAVFPPLCVAVCRGSMDGKRLVQGRQLEASPRAHVEQVREVEEQEGAGDVEDDVEELEVFPLDQSARDEEGARGEGTNGEGALHDLGDDAAEEEGGDGGEEQGSATDIPDPPGRTAGGGQLSADS